MKQSGSFRLLGSSSFVFALAAVFFLIALAPVGSVSAAPGFRVNSTGDGGDAAVGNGVCETASGNGICTLRAAIQESIVNANMDIGITFGIPTSDPGYNAQTGAWTINLTFALPDLSKSSRIGPTTMNITGPGVNLLTVQRASTAVFRIFNITTAGTVGFSGLTIARGYAFDSNAIQGGGGIQNANGGTVNITNCTLSGNISNTPGRGGGGIYNTSNGTVNVTNSTLKFNQAVASGLPPGHGGGIHNESGTVNITNCTFDHNNSIAGGGGISNGGVVTVTGSTFRDNGSVYEGGGIENASASSSMSVTNSTFYANIAFGTDSNGPQGVGGGIFIRGTLNLSNSTLSANFSGVAGSGVFNQTGTANVKSSIIALNYGGMFDSGGGPDVYGTFVSQGFNLIGKKDGSTGFTVATDKKGTIALPLNPKFDIKGLRNNGGPTETIALQTGSPAVDKGTSVGLNGTDIGAFELSP